MIKISNLNKYYYRGENREIHVINNVSLELPSTGFVTILGPSGSGKTTLLNVIGGLDSFDSGKIEYDNHVFHKYDRNRIDEFRKKEIGYIFQNYLLIDNFSVYQNLKEALEIIGITDSKEQKLRIDYVLKKVGLLKYRYKKVKNLSGGQMQRVSIARALLKNASIIIADEPTGNIDSENTIEIMNILKMISQKTLVLLVTHEINIANHYSDRIIQLKDGQVLFDGNVINHGILSSYNDKKIYIKDYQKEENKFNGINLSIYTKDNTTESDVQLIKKNDTIYIKSNQKVVNLNDSSIEVVDYNESDDQKLRKENFEYDISWFNNDINKQKTSVFSKIKSSFISLFSGKKNVLFIIINTILCFIIAICTITFANTKYINFDNVYPFDDIYVINNDKTIQNEIIPEYKKKVLIEAYKNGHIDEIVPFDIIQQYVYFDVNFIETVSCYVNTTIVAYPFEMELELGKKPENNEIVLGKALAEKMLNDLAINKDFDFLLGYSLGGYKIVGISACDSMLAYVNFAKIYNPNVHFTRIDQNAIGYALSYQNIYQITEGSNITNDHELMISNHYKNHYSLEIGNKYVINNEEYVIVGFYEFDDNLNCHNILTSDKSIVGYSFSFETNSIESRKTSYQTGYLPSEKYEIINGHSPLGENECIVNINSGLKLGTIYEGFEIVGQYSYLYEDDKTFNLVLDDLIITNSINFIEEITYIGFRPSEDAEEYFDEVNYQMMSLNDYQKNYLMEQNKSQKNTSIVVIFVMLFIVIIFTYFIRQSKIIKEIKTYGVYRSLGKNHKELIHKHIANICAEATFSVLISFGIVYFVYYVIIYKFVKHLTNAAPFSAGALILGIVSIYLINVVIGSIPLRLLLRKTPSEINSKYDI